MSDAKSLDISGIRFSSTVFPSAADMALWESLSTEERQAVIARDEEAGAQSGIAAKESLEQRLKRVRSGAV